MVRRLSPLRERASGVGHRRILKDDEALREIVGFVLG